MDGLIRSLYTFKFDAFGITIDSGNIVDTVQRLTDFSKVTDINIWGIGKIVNDCMVPVGLSLLVLFFMISMIKKSFEVEKISWERILISVVIFFLLKYFIENGYDFLTAVMNLVNDIFTKIASSITSINTNLNVAESLLDAVPSKFIDGILTYGLYLILFIPFMTTVVQIFTQIFLRIVKLILCFAFSPIAVGVSLAEEGRAKAVQYFMFCASVGLEAIIIYLGTNIYAVGLSGLSNNSANSISTIVAMLFLNGIYLAIIQYRRSVCRKINRRSLNWIILRYKYTTKLTIIKKKYIF